MIFYDNLDLKGEKTELAFEDASNSKMHQVKNECFRQYLNLHVNFPDSKVVV